MSRGVATTRVRIDAARERLELALDRGVHRRGLGDLEASALERLRQPALEIRSSGIRSRIRDGQPRSLEAEPRARIERTRAARHAGQHHRREREKSRHDLGHARISWAA
jgi:hypothetical protein